MKVTMILLAMLAMLAIALAAPNQDRAEASGYRSNKHYDYPKKHYEDYEHKDRDYYETYEPAYEPSYNGPKHYKTKVIKLFPGPVSACNEMSGTAATGAVDCGNTVGITRPLYADIGTTNYAATLYQTGVAVFSSTGVTDAANQANARFIYQQSFRFGVSSPFGEGTIQTQGDDTGPADATYTNRAIIGGTGVFTGVTGYLTRGGMPATTNPGPFEFVITNWNGYGYGY